jgi:hypothetical protein
MCQKLLERLTSDDFILSTACVATSEALRHFLTRSEEVRDIRKAIEQGAITEEFIRVFVARLMEAFHAGERFEHEMAITALAVALERRPTDFAEEFLMDLAKLKLAEMPLCIRVARECVKQRATVTQNKGKAFDLWTRQNQQPLLQVNSSGFFVSGSIRTTGDVVDMRSMYAKA